MDGDYLRAVLKKCYTLLAEKSEYFEGGMRDRILPMRSRGHFHFPSDIKNIKPSAFLKHWRWRVSTFWLKTSHIFDIANRNKWLSFSLIKTESDQQGNEIEEGKNVQQ